MKLKLMVMVAYLFALILDGHSLDTTVCKDSWDCNNCCLRERYARGEVKNLIGIVVQNRECWCYGAFE